MTAKLDATKAKKAVEETAAKTVRFTITMIKIIFILIILYTVAVTIWVYSKEGLDNFLTSIATTSIAGFWAFFLGYFGWRLGQSIEAYFYDMRKKKK